MSNTNDLTEFKNYVDDYIKANTAYGSAHEIIVAKIKKPFFAGGKIRKVKKQYTRTINYAIDLIDFRDFLNDHLCAYPDMFAVWHPMLLEAPGFARSMLTGNNNPKWTEKEFGDPSLDNRNDEHTIGTTLGKKEGIVVNIIITHENFDAKNENRNIVPEVDPRVFGAPCHSKYALTVKLAPIIRAAVDYYLDVYLPNKG